MHRQRCRGRHGGAEPAASCPPTGAAVAAGSGRPAPPQSVPRHGWGRDEAAPAGKEAPAGAQRQGPGRAAPPPSAILSLSGAPGHQPKMAPGRLTMERAGGRAARASPPRAPTAFPAGPAAIFPSPSLGPAGLPRVRRGLLARHAAAAPPAAAPLPAPPRPRDGDTGAAASP